MCSENEERVREIQGIIFIVGIHKKENAEEEPIFIGRGIFHLQRVDFVYACLWHIITRSGGLWR